MTTGYSKSYKVTGSLDVYKRQDFLRTQGETHIKSGREYRWKEHDSPVSYTHLDVYKRQLGCNGNKHQPDADQAQRAEPHGLAAQLAVCTAL